MVYGIVCVMWTRRTNTAVLPLPMTLPTNTRQAAGISWKKSMVNALPASIMGAGSLCYQKPEKRPTSILCSILFGSKHKRQKEEKPENAVFSGLFNGADGRIRTGDLILTKDTGTCGSGDGLFFNSIVKAKPFE